jgi:hypothetical protein
MTLADHKVFGAVMVGGPRFGGDRAHSPGMLCQDVVLIPDAISLGSQGGSVAATPYRTRVC